MKLLVSLKTSNFMKIHEILKRHTEWYAIWLEKYQFLVIQYILVIFPTNTPKGSKLSLEKGYFMKIYNISLKHSERDSICLKCWYFY